LALAIAAALGRTVALAAQFRRDVVARVGAARIDVLLRRRQLVGHGRGGRQVLVVATVEGRDRLAGGLLDVLQQRTLVIGAEADGDAVLALARRAADPVDIGLGHVGQLVVEHVADVVHVDAARGDVGGDQRLDFAGLERGQGPFALALGFVAMDGGALDAAGDQVLGHAVGAALGAGEDDGALDALVGQQFGQQGPLALGLDEDQRLVDALDRGGLRGDRHLGRVLQQLAGQLADLAGHGGREEQVLAFLGQLAGDLADRHHEAQVQHLVGFVEHEDLDAVQVGGLFAQVVHQAARGGHDHVDAGRQGLHLRAVLHAAEDGGDRQAHVGAVGLEVVGDLRRELAGRGEDQAAEAAARGRLTVLGQAVQDRQGEGGGLAGAGLGDAQQVAARQHGRDGLRLDRGRGGVALVGQRLQEGLGKAEIGKLSQVRCFRQPRGGACGPRTARLAAGRWGAPRVTRAV
jgi:hypothetical protein